MSFSAYIQRKERNSRFISTNATNEKWWRKFWRRIQSMCEIIESNGSSKLSQGSTQTWKSGEYNPRLGYFLVFTKRLVFFVFLLKEDFKICWYFFLSICFSPGLLFNRPELRRHVTPTSSTTRHDCRFGQLYKFNSNLPRTSPTWYWTFYTETGRRLSLSKCTNARWFTYSTILSQYFKY